MSRVRVAAVAALALLCLASAGCSSARRSVAPGPEVVSVTGWVTGIRDLRPVDGGVDLTLQPDSGSSENAYLESLYSPQPKPQALLDLHHAVSELALGDRVRATGERTGRGILMTGLERLGGR